MGHRESKGGAPAKLYILAERITSEKGWVIRSKIPSISRQFTDIDLQGNIDNPKDLVGPHYGGDLL